MGFPASSHTDSLFMSCRHQDALPCLRLLSLRRNTAAHLIRHAYLALRLRTRRMCCHRADHPCRTLLSVSPFLRLSHHCLHADWLHEILLARVFLRLPADGCGGLRSTLGSSVVLAFPVVSSADEERGNSCPRNPATYALKLSPHRSVFASHDCTTKVSVPDRTICQLFFVSCLPHFVLQVRCSSRGLIESTLANSRCIQ